jgi:hypothetical protein
MDGDLVDIRVVKELVDRSASEEAKVGSIEDPAVCIIESADVTLTHRTFGMDAMSVPPGARRRAINRTAAQGSTRCSRMSSASTVLTVPSSVV